jgi:ribosomal protein S1
MTPTSPHRDPSPGDVVRARVVTVARYGLHLVAGSNPATVLLDELSWLSTVDPSQVARVGDEIDLRILRWDPQFGITGSIKRVHPELDPWHTPSRFAPGTRFTAEVVSQTPYGFWIKHPSGIEVDLPSELCQGRDLKVSDTIDVIVVASDSVRRTMTVAPTDG